VLVSLFVSFTLGSDAVVDLAGSVRGRFRRCRGSVASWSGRKRGRATRTSCTIPAAELDAERRAMRASFSRVTLLPASPD
jgi:hypothetical protein